RDFDHFRLGQQFGQPRTDRGRHLLVAGKHGELDANGKTHGLSSLSSVFALGAGAVLRCPATGWSNGSLPCPTAAGTMILRPGCMHSDAGSLVPLASSNIQ